MGDDELAAIVHDDKVEIYVLFVAGVPAGFVELDFRTMGQVEIVLLGLVPEFTGQGLGGFLLDWAVDAAWRPATEVLKVTTNTQDHPRALGMYQKAGFNVTGRAESYLVPLSAIEAGTLAAPEQDA
jgi:ribosomal protein S18 acetylase RimI-like enzyme